jgi:hypothetical protein
MEKRLLKKLSEQNQKDDLQIEDAVNGMIKYIDHIQNNKDQLCQNLTRSQCSKLDLAIEDMKDCIQDIVQSINQADEAQSDINMQRSN